MVAEQLALDGHQVRYVTPLPSVATWTDFTLDQSRIIDRLNELGVELWPNLKLSNARAFSHQLNGDVVEFDFDTMVLVGARSPVVVSGVGAQQIELQADIDIFVAGDGLVPGTIQAAVLSGHQTARDILAGRSTLREQKRDQIAFPAQL